jgi:aspartokinase-like uncharacterized kinase
MMDYKVSLFFKYKLNCRVIKEKETEKELNWYGFEASLITDIV